MRRGNVLLRLLAILAMPVLAAAPPAEAQGVQTETMPMAQTVHVPTKDGTILTAKLFLPTGPVTGAAIVALHGCGGPFPKRERQWGSLLAAAGHPVLMPDSFGSRGLGSQCRVHDRTVRPGRQRRDDALASAKWLTSQSFTRPGGVVLLGWSNGGSTVLATTRQSASLPAGLLRGAVAFYPGCRIFAANAHWHPATKLLILIGEADDWTPAAPCRELAARFPDQITLMTYPGAYHDFDVPGRPVRVRHGLAYTGAGTGTAHVGTNPAAREDVLARVPAFIDGLR